MEISDFGKLTINAAKDSVTSYFRPLSAFARWITGPLYQSLSKLYLFQPQVKSTKGNPFAKSSPNAIFEEGSQQYQTRFKVKRGLSTQAIKHIIDRYVHALVQHNAKIIDSNQSSAGYPREALRAGDEEITLIFTASNISLDVLNEVPFDDSNVISFKTIQLRPSVHIDMHEVISQANKRKSL